VCGADAEGTRAPLASCDQSTLPDTICCADSGWPSSGDCLCATGGLVCGPIAGSWSGNDAASENSCACPDGQPVTDGTDATCYPNGTTTAGDGPGTCCLVSVPYGLHSCTCIASQTGCDPGATEVPDCSAARLSPQVCAPGTTQVMACR
jgi:hypothetical protein